MLIATWNVNSLKVRLPQVLSWLGSCGCDVLALQELKLDNANFPLDEFTKAGYHVVFNGQKTYNGVALVSKLPITDVLLDIPDYTDPQKRVISATINDVRIICVYVVNGEHIDSGKYTYKLEWLGKLHDFVAASMVQYPKLVVLGDFNIAPQDIDVYDPIAWQNQVLCSAPERAAWERMLALGLMDSFRLLNTEPKQYSWWDYRNFAFKRKLGLRIDHILVSSALKDGVESCVIDVAPRRNERPSDHAPVILYLCS